MSNTSYWADAYVEKQVSAGTAIGCIQPGQRVFIGSSCGEPQHLVRALSDARDSIADLEILRLMSMESTPLTSRTAEASPEDDSGWNVRQFYLGSARPRALAEKARFITPMNLSAIPGLFRSRRMPIHVALIQTTPPDDFGWLSLGVSVDISLAAALSADLVIAQINPRMPRVLGRSFLHLNEVDLLVPHEEPLLTVTPGPETDAGRTIGRLIARLVEDGATLQINPGTTPEATLLALADKNDLGVHSQFLTESIMHLFSRGVINNRHKGFNNGKMVASTAIGSENLYEFINDNPAIEFHPSDYVNRTTVIARHHRMLALNVAMAMDLTGQVAADALPYNHFSGVSGMLDFARGAALSEGGRSILMMPSTAMRGAKSRIVPQLNDIAVVVPRGDVHYICTEYGLVNLFGKSLQERALAMISIAHPDYRDELFDAAREMKLLNKERVVGDAIHGVYPLRLEESFEIDNMSVTIRPAKPVDERRIQEHFYGLDAKDVRSRFFHNKRSFTRDEVGTVSQVDYVNNLTMVAVVGEFGFGQVVGIGEYLLDPATNLAEIAFSVSTAWQGKGLGRLLQSKLAEGARDNGIAGLVAYTTPENHGMVHLFQCLPYTAHTALEGGMIRLSCRFDEPLAG
ncbi:MAG: GNAT family N-acetyltransferase [Desulfosarcinaceae bacterium]|nr:GNAT family N-acetyltransferase [Desulfosarcinaceae bacterium]